MIQWRADGLFLLILIAAIGVRMYGIGDACYWLDEFDSLEASSGRGLAHVTLAQNQWLTSPPALTTLQGAPAAKQIWSSLNFDNHPPLYFILLRAWREMFGDGETATRMMSLIFSVVALTLFYAILRLQMPGEAALWAAALMAFASSQVYFAQQSRGYAMWDALAMLGCWILLSIERRGARPICLFGLFLAALAMLLTHYFAALTVVSLFLIALLQMREERRWKSVAAIVSASVVDAAVWGVFLLRQRATLGENNRWQIDLSNHHALATLQRFCLLPLRWISEGAVNDLNGIPGIAAAIAIAIICTSLVIALRRRREMMFWLVFLLPLAVTVCMIDLIHGSRLLSVSRYTFAAGPGIFALLAAGAAGLHTRVGRTLARVACVIALAVSLATLNGVYSQDQDWRQVAAVLQHNVRPGDRIVYDSGGRERWWAGALYLGVSHYAPHLPAEVMLLTDDHSPALVSALSNGHSTWMLCAEPNRSPTFLFPGAKVLKESVVPDIGVVSQLTK